METVTHVWVYTVFICVCATTSVVRCLEDDEASTNVYGSVNQAVRMACDVPLSDPPEVLWYDWVHNVDRRPQRIYSASGGVGTMDPTHPNAANYHVDNEKFTLTIERLSLEDDPGEYACQSNVSGVLHKRTYDLVIVGNPQCSSNATNLTVGDGVGLNCQSAYAGTLLPDLEWVRGSDSEPVESVDRNEINLAKHTVELKTSPDDDRRKYTCHRKFGDVTEECSVTLHVTYAVQNLTLDPVGDVYKVNDVVACKARGQPLPEVRLTADPSPTAGNTDGHSVTLPAEWAGQQINISCTAQNSVNDILHRISLVKLITVILVTDPPTKKAEMEKPAATTRVPDDPPTPDSATASTSNTGVIVGIIVAVAVIILVVVAIFCIRKRKQRKQKGAKRVPLTDTA